MAVGEKIFGEEAENVHSANAPSYHGLSLPLISFALLTLLGFIHFHRKLDLLALTLACLRLHALL